MESPGTRLKRLRLEKGVSLEEMHKKTKVHLNILKAIEEDNLIDFSPIYVKGFLKIYCKFLGVDPHDYIPDYKEPKYEVTLARGISQAQEKPKSILEAASTKFDSFRLNIKMKTVFVIIGIILAIIVFFKLGQFIAWKSKSSKKTIVSEASKPNSQKTTPAKEVKPITAAAKSIKLSDESTPQKSATILRLGIRAKEDCWIQLKTDGRVVFQNILKKGRFESWRADDKIELSLGNAGVVDLEVNGKVISSLGRKGQVIKNIIITREGLSLPR